jgi:hypothetical protein
LRATALWDRGRNGFVGAVGRGPSNPAVFNFTGLTGVSGRGVVGELGDVAVSPEGCLVTDASDTFDTVS